MPELFAQPLLSFAASALGALLAGYYGVRFGLRQYRAERAMDRRLAWYAELAEVSQTLLNRTRSLQAFEKGGGTPKAAAKLVEELANLSFRFQELAMMAEFYAAPDTVEVLDETMRMLNKLGADMSGPNPGPAGEEAMRESMRIIYAASRLLARDVRKELGLEPLESHRVLPPSRS